MTTFEITIIVLLAAIVVLLIVLLRIAIEGFHGVWQNQNEQWNQLRDIGQELDEKFKHLTDKADRKLSAIINYTYEAKQYLREVKDIERKNQELLMPIIKWQRRLVGADSATCETTDKEE